MESCRSVLSLVSFQPLPFPWVLTIHHFTATTSYRLHPLIVLKPENPIPPHLAKKFADCFSPGVVKIGKNNEVWETKFLFMMSLLLI